MSLLSKPDEKVVLASPLNGVITYKGEPVSNAKMTRVVKWKDDKGEVETIMTDDSGFFNFVVKEDIVKIYKLTQFIIYQEIFVYYHGEKFNIWTMGTGSKTEHGELGGVPVNLRCELTDEMTRIEVEDGLLGTSCKWDEISKQGDKVE